MKSIRLRRTQAMIIAASMLTAACREPISPDPISYKEPVVLSAWAGSTVMLRGVHIATDTLRINGSTADYESFAGDSVALHIPDTAEGNLYVTIDRLTRPIASITVAGVKSYSTIPIASSQMMPWPTGGVASVLYAQEIPNSRGRLRLVRLEPRFHGFAQPLVDTIDYSFAGVRQPGLTPDPRIVYLRRPAISAVQMWQLSPSVAQLGLASIPLSRHSAQMANGRGVYTDPHRILTVQGPSFTLLGNFEEPQSIAMSPDASLVFVATHAAADHLGMAIIDTAGQMHRIGSIERSHGAVFNGTSDTLFVGGGYVVADGSSRGALFVVDPRTGAVEKQINFGYDQPNRVALDPIGPWIYVVTDEDELSFEAHPPVLFVIDRRDLTLVARIPIPKWAICSGFCDPVVVAGTDGLYALTRSEMVTFSRPQ